MRTTLFVTDIPFNLTENEFVTLFSGSDGFITARLRSDRNRNIVGFVEFENEASAQVAKSNFNQYKFSVTDLGLNVRFSHNNTSQQTSPSAYPGSSRRIGRERSDHRSPQTDHSLLHSQHQGLSLPQSQVNTTSSTSPIQPDGFGPYYSSQSVNYSPNGYATHQHGSYFLQQPQSTYPPDASTTLYVEGLPNDCTEREVAHIFRPFAGYQSVRLLQKESKTNPAKIFTLCFVEFDSKYQATVSMNALNGYRMDKNDTKGLKISYAKARKERRGGNASASGPSPASAPSPTSVTSTATATPHATFLG